ncbi:hypothetical protein EV182_000981 [Spiromyces aspiralis]|uniref:Uncharacterized protein n=1 Tax=Spiromyces aspiralis TaxID=68401 RepID=A0ACC1HWB5_9FUNG|nr:hypothetical protein EV182_000981 [Spiromyces aspiralis]
MSSPDHHATDSPPTPAVAAVSPYPSQSGGPKLSSIPEGSGSPPLQPPSAIEEHDPIRIKLAVEVASAPEELQVGLSEIIIYHPVPYFLRHDDPPSSAVLWHVRFEKDHRLGRSFEILSNHLATQQGQTSNGDNSICYSNSSSNNSSDGNNDAANNTVITIRYNRPTEAFRGLGHVLTSARMFEMRSPDEMRCPAIFTREEAKFETLALMIDCSRNGVLTVSSICEFLRYMALSGYSMLQLYTEDTYKVPGEPFFGYLRGGYTKSELEQVDNYAFALGIEVIPCIQTLGHLGQILQWPPYAGLRDTHEVILSRSDDTYKFLEKIIRTISSCFRSKRIHIGMDEAYGVGEGRFKQIFGSHDSAEVFVEHLQRVNQICIGLGLKPMIWSDMLFCLAAKNNALYAYYDQSNNPSDLDKMRGIPNNIELVFWDYYHTAPEIYKRKIQQHRDLGCEDPWVAGAAWTWSRLWCALPFSFESNRASLTSAKDPEGGVNNFMLTLWGDEGNECDYFSALPAILYVGHQAYTDSTEIDINIMENSFAAICGGDLEEWVKCSRLDEAPSNAPMDIRPQMPSNMSKWLLWEDPILSFMSPQYADIDLQSHFTMLANNALYKAHTASALSFTRYPLNRLLRLPGLLARVLALKCHLREDLVNAYRTGDRAKLLEIARTRIQALLEAERELWLFHRTRWHRIYKPFGWEVLELRYGGLTARLQTFYDRIISYAVGARVSDLGYSRALAVTAGLGQIMDGLWPPPPATVSGTEGESAKSLQGDGHGYGEMREDHHHHQQQQQHQRMDVDDSDNMVIPDDMSKQQSQELADRRFVDASDGENRLQPPQAFNSVTITLDGKDGSKSMQLETSTPSHILPVLTNTSQPIAKPMMTTTAAEESMYRHHNYEHDVTIDSLPELEEDLHCVYENAYTNLIIDYGRVSTPSRLG